MFVNKSNAYVTFEGYETYCSAGTVTFCSFILILMWFYGILMGGFYLYINFWWKKVGALF